MEDGQATSFFRGQRTARHFFSLIGFAGEIRITDILSLLQKEKGCERIRIPFHTAEVLDDSLAAPLVEKVRPVALVVNIDDFGSHVIRKVQFLC